MTTLRVVSEKQVFDLLDTQMQAAMDACAEAYQYFGREGSVLSTPSSLYLDLPGPTTRRCRLKGAHLDVAGVAGFRLASPGSYFTWVLDVVSGSPIGLVSENWLHRRRTAVTGALTLAWLNPHLTRLTLIGAGKIGRECALALAHAFPNAAITLGCRDRGKGDVFRMTLPSSVAERLQVTSIEDACRSAEAVLTITKASEAFVEATWLQPGTIALSMGGVPEFQFAVWGRTDAFFLDDVGYALKQGDLHHWVKNDGLTESEIQGRLTATVGQLALDPHAYQSRPDSDLTLAIVQGMAVCDLAMAALVLRDAENQGVGQVVEIDN